ncbi:MAG TPA: N-acetylglucosamine-6-phosphate deacetylase [Blastocatellia bacterium]|nr:N-acetylglucosamine-6-phosphate deacetylase [Blastocatellia bacterium]
MTQLLLHNARVVLEDRVQPGGVLAREGRIAEVFAGDDGPAGLGANEKIDLGGAYLAPGMIDLHIHGSAGVDVQNTDYAGLAKLSEFLLAEGVTGYFATYVPTDDRGYRAALAEIAAYTEGQDSQPPRARILGIHFEGPFVNHNRCGALQRQHFRTYDGDPRSVEVFTGANRLMTLAPEIEGGLALTRELTAGGVRVFIGHSQADPETLDRAFAAGARHITHFPNALDPMHHRKPGAVGWSLVRRDVTVDCIADFQHVHPLMLRLIYQTKGADRMALISDAIMAAGLGDGEFEIWGDKIAVRDGITALMEGPAKGTIAGSVIAMRQALANVVSLGVPVEQAARMAALTPAHSAGIAGEYGSIAPGKRADLIAFDEDFSLKLAVVGGRIGLNHL